MVARRADPPGHGGDGLRTKVKALHDGLVLITRKDAVKCQHLNDSRLWVVDVQPEFSRPDWIAELDSLLRKRRLTPPSLSGVQ